jgi:hypothetical protein
VVAVHVWIIDGDCMKVKRVELVMCELDDASEERCTVEVMLFLEQADHVRTGRWLRCGAQKGDRLIQGRPWGPLSRSGR